LELIYLFTNLLLALFLVKVLGKADAKATSSLLRVGLSLAMASASIITPAKCSAMEAVHIPGKVEGTRGDSTSVDIVSQR
jgi:hypothetical protein